MSNNTSEKVKNWNSICGKTAPVVATAEYFLALDAQVQRIEEELQELKGAITDAGFFSRNIGKVIGEGHEKKCITTKMVNEQLLEILDAGCDLDVVVSGLNYLSGHDYNGAIDAVLKNNDLKYTFMYEYAKESKNELQNKPGNETFSIVKVEVQLEGYESDNLSKEFIEESGYTHARYDESTNIHYVYAFSVHRDSDDKICKLSGHPKVDLTPFAVTM